MIKLLTALVLGLLRPIAETSDFEHAPFFWSLPLIATLAGCAIFADHFNTSLWVPAVGLVIIVAIPLTIAELGRMRQGMWRRIVLGISQ